MLDVGHKADVPSLHPTGLDVDLIGTRRTTLPKHEYVSPRQAKQFAIGAAEHRHTSGRHPDGRLGADVWLGVANDGAELGPAVVSTGHEADH